MATNSHHFSQQYPLDIAPRTFATFETFVSTRDNVLLDSLKELRIQLKEPRQFYLWGAGQTGKSHLLQAICNHLASTKQNSIYLPLNEFSSNDSNILQDIHHLDVVCVDDVDQVIGDYNWEKALFQLINELRIDNKSIVMTASNKPSAMKLLIPDLASRLVWGPVYKLNVLDDEQKATALQLHAEARGFKISSDVCGYLIKRYSRELKRLVGLLNQIDQQSLIQKRKVTVPFVKTVLDEL